MSPLLVVVDEDIESLRAEDASGSFGILPGHALFLTAIAISIVSWRTATVERFCAVRGGLLSVSGTTSTTVTVATREGVVGDHLATLDDEVLSRFLSDEEAERVDRAGSVQLQLNAIRHLVSRLGSSADTGRFR